MPKFNLKEDSFKEYVKEIINEIEKEINIDKIKNDSLKQKNGDSDSVNLGAKENKVNKPKVDIDVDMNSNDDSFDENVPKTFVQPGKEMSDGQKKANFFDKAKNEKDIDSIVKAIQLPENFLNKPMNKKELGEFILAEAKKLLK